MSGTSVMTPPEVQASTTSWHVSEWRVGEGARVDQGQTLAILEDGTGVLVEVPSPFSGCLLQRRLEVGALIPDNHAELALIEACEHEVLHGGVCAECGQCVTLGANREESETVLAYTSPHLHIGKKAAQRLDQEYIQRLVQEKRLVLVLDLDHTLLHATNDLRAATFMQKVAGVSVKPKPPHQQEPSPAQLSRPGGTEDNAERLTEEELHSFYLDGSSTPYIIKLRPDVRTFLADVSQKYELHMYTMGGGLYAREIQRILDPDGKLFQERITSRDDFPEGQLNRKNLQRLFPYDDSLVVIVDDREDVWARQDGQPVLNLLHARPYYFFMGLSESYDRTSRVGQTKGRDPEPNNATKPIEKMVEKWRERDRADKLHMLRLGKVLEECHRRFYATPPQPACDTKVIVAGQLAELLKGCRLAFTGVFNCDPQKKSFAADFLVFTTGILGTYIPEMMSVVILFLLSGWHVGLAGCWLYKRGHSALLSGRVVCTTGDTE
eukprot:Ihof_evm2s164 gene=Ihof_evmTU2s164